LNKILAELFQEKFLLERKKEKEIMEKWRGFRRMVFIFFLWHCVLDTVVVKMIIRKANIQECLSLLLFCFLASFLFFFAFIWLYFRTLSLYSKKLKQIDQKIIKELKNN